MITDRRDIKGAQVIKYLLKGRWERGDRIQLTAWAPLLSLCANRARPAMTSMLDFTSYDRKSRRGSRCIFPSLSMGFLGVQLFPLASFAAVGQRVFSFTRPAQTAPWCICPCLFQRLCRFSCRILTSPSAMPLPTAHSFLYYKHNAFPRDGEGGKPCSLYMFLSRIDRPSFPHRFGEK